jgi:hypothetical protein
MGVVVAAGLFLTLVCVILGTLAMAVAKYYGQAKRAQPIILGSLGLIFFVALTPTAQFVYTSLTTTKVGLTGPEADQLVAFLGVPPNTAKDVCWRSSPGGLHTDFLISEPAFHDWMNSQGWETQSFSTYEEGESLSWRVDGVSYGSSAEVHPVRGFKEGQVIRVNRGYQYFDVINGDADLSTTMVYDRDAERAYVIK